MNIIWSRRARIGLEKVINYLKEVWTENEVLNLERRLEAIFNQLKKQPEMFPTTSRKANLRKAVVDKNNYLIYRWDPADERIIVIIFRGTRQKPIHL
jgi:plasmid stabilization system protein ParE